MARRLRDSEKKQTHKLEGISWGINLSQYDSIRGTCVYKLFYGKKFIIHKGKTLSGSLFILEKNYKYFVAYNHQSNDKDVDYYYKFYDYIRKHEGLEFKIEVLGSDLTASDSLTLEHRELELNFTNKHLMNNNTKPYIPKYKEATDSYGWITKDELEKYYQTVTY
jgi:hypothetical protein